MLKKVVGPALLTGCSLLVGAEEFAKHRVPVLFAFVPASHQVEPETFAL